MFEAELEFFIANQGDFVTRYANKFLVIHDHEVVAVCDSPLEAYAAGLARFAPGEFMIQQCVPGPAAYSVTIASSEVMLDKSA